MLMLMYVVSLFPILEGFRDLASVPPVSHCVYRPQQAHPRSPGGWGGRPRGGGLLQHSCLVYDMDEEHFKVNIASDEA